MFMSIRMAASVCHVEQVRERAASPRGARIVRAEGAAMRGAGGVIEAMPTVYGAIGRSEHPQTRAFPAA